MRRPVVLALLITAAAIASFAGCAAVGSSAISTNPIPRQEFVHTASGSAHHVANFYTCSLTGTLEYVSDFYNNYINVYHAPFPARRPCAQIGYRSVGGPEGLYVDRATHDLYVANYYGSGLGGPNVSVFHRGSTDSYSAYNDPTSQNTQDVTVASDGTIIASNVSAFNGPEKGSISTWIGGPNGGTFVGNFPMTNSSSGGFITLKKNGIVYFNDVDATSGTGALWTVSCPAGQCGVQHQVAGVSLGIPGGMAFDNAGDLLAVSTEAQAQSHAHIFELPNPNPTTVFLFSGGTAEGVAFSPRDNRFFVTNLIGIDNSFAYVFSYPSGNLIGMQDGNLNGGFTGIAIDP